MKHRILLFTLILIGGISVGTSYALTEINNNDDVFINSGKKLHFDTGGDTFIYEVGPNRLDVNVGGSIAQFYVSTGAGINPGQKLFIPRPPRTDQRRHSAITGSPSP